MATIPGAGALPPVVLQETPIQQEEEASWQTTAINVATFAVGMILSIPLIAIAVPFIIMPTFLASACRNGLYKMVTWLRLTFVDGAKEDVVLRVRATHDYNDAFKDPRIYFEQIADRYPVIECLVSNVDDIATAIQNVPAHQRIKILWISAHGSPTDVRLGQEEEQTLNTQNVQDLQEAFQQLAPDADIVLDACSAGDSTMPGLTSLLAQAVISNRELHDKMEPAAWAEYYEGIRRDCPLVANLFDESLKDPNWLEKYQATAASDQCLVKTIATWAPGRTVHASTQIKNFRNWAIASVNPLKIIYLPWGEDALSKLKHFWYDLFATHMGIALAPQDAITTYYVAPDSPLPHPPQRASTPAALSLA